MKGFTKTHTQITKGIAILLMLWHHLFYDSPEYYEKFISLKKIRGIPLESLIASGCKVCVAVFLFLSGYGLYRSYVKAPVSSLKGKLKFAFNHLCAVLTDYWFIFIIFVPAGFLFDRNPLLIYRHSFRYFLDDFFGMSFFWYGWGAPTMNDTWWFMSIILIYYLICPFLISLLKKYPEVTLVLAALVSLFSPGFHDLNRWLFPFVLGIWFARRDIFEKAAKAQKRLLPAAVCCLLIIIAGAVRLSFARETFVYTFDGFYAALIALFDFICFSGNDPAGKFLSVMGNYSGMIFMFHTFIFEYYFPDFIYSPKYAPLIFLLLTVICLLTAFCLDTFKKLIRFSRFQNRLKIS